MRNVAFKPEYRESGPLSDAEVFPGGPRYRTAGCKGSVPDGWKEAGFIPANRGGTAI